MIQGYQSKMERLPSVLLKRMDANIIRQMHPVQLVTGVNGACMRAKGVSAAVFSPAKRAAAFSNCLVGILSSLEPK